MERKTERSPPEACSSSPPKLSTASTTSRKNWRCWFSLRPRKANSVLALMSSRDVCYAAPSIQRQGRCRTRRCRASGDCNPARDRRAGICAHCRRDRSLATRVPECADQGARYRLAKVEAFPLDEYIGLPATHPGSFRRMLMERLVSKTGIVHYHLLDGDAADPLAVSREVGERLASAPLDLAFLGIGENGHIAFNDPPADFTTEDPYLIVNLDEGSRRQQVGEAWFSDISQVPRRAISMSPRQILKAAEILVIVPDQRKAKAVKACLEDEISPRAPASILRRHSKVTVYLDADSASLLSPGLRRALTEESQVLAGS